MDDNSNNTQNNAKNDILDNKFVQNAAVNPSSVFNNKAASRVKSDTSILGNDLSDNASNAIRTMLPTFIENEQKYAQVERKRKIHSSPAKSLRRFSQDSSSLEQQLKVSMNEYMLYICSPLNGYLCAIQNVRKAKQIM